MNLSQKNQMGIKFSRNQSNAVYEYLNSARGTLNGFDHCKPFYM